MMDKASRIAKRLFLALEPNLSHLTFDYAQNTSEDEWKSTLSDELDFHLDSFKRSHVLPFGVGGEKDLALDYRCTLQGIPHDWMKNEHFFTVAFFVKSKSEIFFRFISHPLRYWKDMTVDKIINQYGTVENAFKAISSEVVSMIPNAIKKMEEEAKGETEKNTKKDDEKKNGGWGEGDEGWSGGFIQPNLKKLDKDGYALEFWFNTYLEYDQHWSNGYNEKSIIENFKKWAVMGDRSGDWIKFTAKSKDDIAKIKDFCLYKARIGVDI